MTKVIAIAAVAPGGVMGNSDTNDLPWATIRGDLKHFKKCTEGSPMIMGRNTFESLPRALPGRKHIIVTSRQDYSGGDISYQSLYKAVTAEGELSRTGKIFVIGGSEIFYHAFGGGMIDEAILTLIGSPYPGDVLFPFKTMFAAGFAPAGDSCWIPKRNGDPYLQFIHYAKN